jgi:hypothetical protein
MHPHPRPVRGPRRRFSLALHPWLLLLLAPGPSAPVTAPQPGIDGWWEGTIIVREAEIEADMAVHVERHADGALAGTISVPVQDVHDRPFESVVQQGDTFSLVFRDGAELSVFNGRLSADGRTLAGALGEQGHFSKFVLHRQAGPPRPEAEPAVLRPCSASLAELKQRFNADAGHVRLLLILSPGQRGSMVTARLVRRYVLEQLGDDRLRVYVLWVAAGESGTEAAARAAGRDLVDPRSVQFFSPDANAARAFQAPLAFKEDLVREVALIYAADQSWGESIPRPRHFMHRSWLMPEAQRLNAAKLAAALKVLLDALPPR